MSLDVALVRKRWISYDEGKTHTEEGEKIYWANITHNLNKMAGEAGIYEALWRPEEIGVKVAADLIPILEKGSPTVARISYKKSGDEKLGEWIFFGIASC